jgi:hypothetical protein
VVTRFTTKDLLHPKLAVQARQIYCAGCRGYVMVRVLSRHPRITLWVVLIAVASLAGSLVAIALTRGGDTTTATTTVLTTVTAPTATLRTGTRSAPGRTGVTTAVRQVGPFTGVNLAGANVVNIRVGGARSVTVTGERSVVPLVTTRVRSGELVISSRERYTTHGRLHVDVTTPTLSSVVLEGSGRLTAEGVRGPHFAVELGGSGVVQATGRTDDLRAELGGVGDVELGRLLATHARVEVSGSGRMGINVARSLKATLSGTGSIVYRGNPANVSTEVTGSGTITSR